VAAEATTLGSPRTLQPVCANIGLATAPHTPGSPYVGALRAPCARVAQSRKGPRTAHQALRWRCRVLPLVPIRSLDAMRRLRCAPALRVTSTVRGVRAAKKVVPRTCAPGGSWGC
jgi:hypothetical protein